MSERAHLIGGRLAIQSSAGAGTRVTVSVPLAA
jgi:signal transduction histidine kinase